MQLIFHMKTKYDDLTLTHNLSGVILPSERYEQIYKKEAYLTPPLSLLYTTKKSRRMPQELKYIAPKASMKG